MTARFDPQRIRQALASVEDLLQETGAAADARADALAAVPPERRVSALNLLHYLAVRAHDVRPLQRELADLALSSLGRMESRVADTLSGVRFALLALLGERPPAGELRPLFPGDSEQVLARHAAELLGPSPADHQTRVMVTLPTEAKDDRGLLKDLLLAGMGLARINLAHDDPVAWTRMAENLRAAAAECGVECRILADLPGPKLRTGELEPGPRVARVRPERDELGVVTARAQVLFVDPGIGAIPPAGSTLVPLATPLCGLVRAGDELVVEDTRGRRRRFLLEAPEVGTCRGSTDRTAYLGSDCVAELRREGGVLATSRIGLLPARCSFVPLRAGDLLVLTRAATPGRPARTDAEGRVEPPRVPCTLPEVFEDVRPGQRILFDDGLITGSVVTRDADELRVRITDVPPGGARLRAGKGINLPDTDLHTQAIREDDREALDWVAHHADLVGMSFVQRPADVLRLHSELELRARPDLGIVLKIETNKAFERLPSLLLAGLQSPPLGVMVARGDLAVEVGYARLAEVQEEILWLCEAAHVPVIWATQVLDSMARTGIPSRAEVTDAAMGVRAECVMLNKGPYIVETLRFLGGVLERMQAHHAKKRSMLRRLRIAGAPPSA